MVSGEGSGQGDAGGADQGRDGVAGCRFRQARLTVGKTDFGGIKGSPLTQPLLDGEFEPGPGAGSTHRSRCASMTTKAWVRVWGRLRT